MFDGLPEKYETKPDVFSLRGLIAWLETQDPATRYNYVDDADCLLCRYFRSAGYDVFTLSRSGFATWPNIHSNVKYPDEMAAVCNTGLCGAWTYGAALERARKLLASP